MLRLSELHEWDEHSIVAAIFRPNTSAMLITFTRLRDAQAARA